MLLLDLAQNRRKGRGITFAIRHVAAASRRAFMMSICRCASAARRLLGIDLGLQHPASELLGLRVLPKHHSPGQRQSTLSGSTQFARHLVIVRLRGMLRSWPHGAKGRMRPQASVTG